MREVLHKRTGLKRACKAVMIRSPRHFELVETEVSLMRRLDHPNVLRLFESYYDGDRNIYLIIELCNGGSYTERLDQAKPGVMPEMHAAWAARDTLSALKYCHQQGVIHRDIKPDNLLFLRKGADAPLKVIDFGLSDFLSRIERKFSVSQQSQTKQGSPIGTPHYMAPEIYTEGIYDEKVDTFAFGVCLVEAVTGVHPFFELGKDDLPRIREKIVKRGVDYSAACWQNVPAAAREVCQMLLEPDRNRRADARTALEHPWLLHARQQGLNGQAKVRRAVFEALARFRTHNVLKQAAFRVLANQLDDGQVLPMERQFALLDADGSGRISCQELVQGARTSGVDMDVDEISEILAVFARTAHGEPLSVVSAVSAGEAEPEVGFRDFLAAMVERDVLPTEAQMQDVFQRFCAPGASIVTKDSLRAALNPTSGPSKGGVDDVPMSMCGENVSDFELRTCFIELGSGDHIDFKDFCEMWSYEEPDD